MLPNYSKGVIETVAVTATPTALVLPLNMTVQSLTIRSDGDYLVHFDPLDTGFPVVAGAPITLPFDPARQTIYLSGAGTAIIMYAGQPNP